ncbi:MAG: DUF2934 domain-containing protein [Chromatiales bacterium]|nr:DUF2934 domain-containing protein [Chromatiales bacterium]
MTGVAGRRRPAKGAKESPQGARAPAARRRGPASKTRPAAEALPAPCREQMIAEAAYYRAERRNFAGGRELDDWLAAEEEIDSLINPVREGIDEAENIGPIP